MVEMFVTGVISKILVRGVPFIMPANQPGSGFELDALVFGGVFILVVFGAGPIALDHLIATRLKRAITVAALPMSLSLALPAAD